MHFRIACIKRDFFHRIKSSMIWQKLKRGIEESIDAYKNYIRKAITKIPDDKTLKYRFLALHVNVKAAFKHNSNIAIVDNYMAEAKLGLDGYDGRLLDDEQVGMRESVARGQWRSRIHRRGHCIAR